MPSPRLFWKLLLACAGLSLLAIVAFALLLSAQFQEQVVQEGERRLHDSARLLAGELAGQLTPEPNAAVQERVRRLGQQTHTRYTVIAADGTVLADSECATLDEVRAMDNHRDRPEILQARTRGEGRSIRNSATIEERQKYFSVREKEGGQLIGYVRSAIPVAELQSQTAAVRRWIGATGALVAVCLVAALYFAIGIILRPMGALMDSAEAIASGDYSKRVYSESRDELGGLARTFSRISQDLDARSTQIGQTLGRQSTVLGGMIEGVIAIDSRQRIVLANDAAGRLFAFPPADAEGRPLLEVVRNHSVHEAVTKALDTCQPQRIEMKSTVARPVPDSAPSALATRSAAPAGIQQVDIHIQPLPGQPCPGVVLVMHDTTELRRLESLRRDFIANVSHELKTPLSSIKAYTETLRNGAARDPETSEKFLARIEEQAERLHLLINDMLMLARIESDQQPFDITAVDVSAVVTACLDDYRAAAEAKRIELIADSDSQPCRVRADREGLREILNNLIDNAIKYTPEGGRVTVGWNGMPAAEASRESTATDNTNSSSGSQQRWVHIYVRDTGIGIKPKDQQRVFERFYRVDKARSREVGGTGLGLAIVKHLVQSFGGRVSVQSEVGAGSTFTVELPPSYPPK